MQLSTGADRILAAGQTVTVRTYIPNGRDAYNDQQYTTTEREIQMHVRYYASNERIVTIRGEEHFAHMKGYASQSEAFQTYQGGAKHPDVLVIDGKEFKLLSAYASPNGLMIVNGEMQRHE